MLKISQQQAKGRREVKDIMGLNSKRNEETKMNRMEYREGVQNSMSETTEGLVNANPETLKKITYKMRDMRTGAQYEIPIAVPTEFRNRLEVYKTQSKKSFASTAGVRKSLCYLAEMLKNRLQFDKSAKVKWQVKL